MAAIVYLKHTKSHTSCNYFHTKNKKILVTNLEQIWLTYQHSWPDRLHWRAGDWERG